MNFSKQSVGDNRGLCTYFSLNNMIQISPLIKRKQIITIEELYEACKLYRQHNGYIQFVKMSEDTCKKENFYFETLPYLNTPFLFTTGT